MAGRAAAMAAAGRLANDEWRIDEIPCGITQRGGKSNE
jgi:hypothetical protein